MSITSVRYASYLGISLLIVLFVWWTIFYRPDTVCCTDSVWPVKNWMMRCWCGMVQLMPLPLHHLFFH